MIKSKKMDLEDEFYTASDDGNPTEKVHNKSGKSTLALLDNSDTTLNSWLELAKKKFKVIDDGLIIDSKCILMSAKDGKLSVQQKKVAWGYHLVAFDKFGREAMLSVSPIKDKKDSLTISHLCGTRDCCNSEHLIIEGKKINDERTHCHFVLKNIKKAHQKDSANFMKDNLDLFFRIGGCPHEPKCLYLNS